MLLSSIAICITVTDIVISEHYWTVARMLYSRNTTVTKTRPTWHHIQHHSLENKTNKPLTWTMVSLNWYTEAESFRS